MSSECVPLPTGPFLSSWSPPSASAPPPAPPPNPSSLPCPVLFQEEGRQKEETRPQESGTCFLVTETRWLAVASPKAGSAAASASGGGAHSGEPGRPGWLVGPGARPAGRMDACLDVAHPSHVPSP